MKKSTTPYLMIALMGMLFVNFSCDRATATDSERFEQAVRRKAEAYFDTFAQRSDWDAFCSFYREDVHFKDITLQLELDSLSNLKRFYKWDEEGERFKKLYPEQKHLNLQSLIVEANTAVGKGQLNPFYYDGMLVDVEWGMEFTIWLRFDENLKISEQIDWMEYDPGTLETTVNKYKEGGADAILEWLDLAEKE